MSDAASRPSPEVRDEIEDALRRYCRGIDRLDEASIRSAFHAGAELRDYSAASESIESFAARAVTSLGTRFTATQHRLSNTSIELRDGGAAALVETYVLASHVQRIDDRDHLLTFAGRYIDRFERREGEWRIACRTLRCDWSTRAPIEATMGGTWVHSGRGGTPDPLYD